MRRVYLRRIRFFVINTLRNGQRYDIITICEKLLSENGQEDIFLETIKKALNHDNIGKIDGKLKSSKWAKIAKCSADTALRDIKDLIDKGILKQESSGGRSTNYEIAEF